MAAESPVMLTTVSTVKDELGLSGSSEDAWISRAIKRVSAAIEAECGRKFQYNAAAVERHPAGGLPNIALNRAPVISITSIYFDGQLMDEADYELDTLDGDISETGIVYFKSGTRNTNAYINGVELLPVAGTMQRLYVFTFEGGYVTPEQETEELPRTLPYDLEAAAIQAVVDLYNKRGQRSDIQSEALMSASVSYARPKGDVVNGLLSDAVLGMLDDYRRIGMGL